MSVSNDENPRVFGAPLERILENTERRFGAKALNLAKLRKAGLPVPDGLVITTQNLLASDLHEIEAFIQKIDN